MGFWRSLGRSNRLFPRKLVVTREGKWIIGIAILLGAAAVNTGNNLLYLVLSLTISVIAVSGMLSEWCLRDLELRRHYPRELVHGEATVLRVEVHNDKPRAALHIEVGEVLDGEPDVQVRDGFVLHLAGGEVGQAFGAIRPLRRGPVATAGIQLATSYPFGFARKSRIFDDPAEFLVLPQVAPMGPEWRGSLDRGSSELSRKIGQGDNFAGLRDARPGDALRDIYWKASARRGRLMAREWQAEAARVALIRFVHVAPGSDDHPRALDGGCARVAGLCQALLQAGFAVGLQTLDGCVAPVADPTGQGEPLRDIRRALAQLLPADRPPPAEWPLADADWADRVRMAQQRAAAIAHGQPLTWAPVAVQGPAEVYLVRFVSRQDVAVAGTFDAQVLLNTDGSVAGIERPALRNLARGAA
ncbi:MAG: DUF58 domain-containing protein [Deltaproteobacteria bacterium]|nr:DUF58 domain-containing protein [Deltaproteobacteria bacterium]